MLFFLITQMLPSTLVLTSLYIMFSKMHLLNTYWAPILADATLGIPFSIIILRTYFVSIPKELDEAAKMDGCTFFQIFYMVILPLLKPVHKDHAAHCQARDCGGCRVLLCICLGRSDLRDYLYHKPQHEADYIQYLQLCAAVPDTVEFHHGIRNHCHYPGGADIHFHAEIYCKRTYQRRGEGVTEGQGLKKEKEWDNEAASGRFKENTYQ